MIYPVQLRQPRIIEFGVGTRTTLSEHVAAGARVFVVCDAAVLPSLGNLGGDLLKHSAAVEVFTDVVPEPPLEEVVATAELVSAFAPDVIIGIGGGSSIDLAKVLAVLYGSDQSVSDIIGIDAVAGRRVRLLAMPTTAGTGSEVTPIAVLTDAQAHLKKGVVSTFLIPDVAIVDPELTVTAPAAITASTGIDALTHCIEAFTNVHAHPIVDLYALEGIRLISTSVERAVHSGTDVEARTAMALGSLYGGLCLGPVNTAAVHAMAYPLGGTFKVAHGVANSILLPWVMRFNAETNPDRYHPVAVAMGVAQNETPTSVAARAAVSHVERLSRACGIPRSLKEFGVAESDLDKMAADAVKVTRLMNNNPRTVSEAQAREIYRQALAGNPR